MGWPLASILGAPFAIVWIGFGCCNLTPSEFAHELDESRATINVGGGFIELLTPGVILVGDASGAELRDAPAGTVLPSGTRVLARSDGLSPARVDIPDALVLTIVRTDPTRPIRVRGSALQGCMTQSPRLMVLSAMCGNGIREVGEQCDDGNADADDGCTACALDRARCGSDGTFSFSECGSILCTRHECPDAADPLCSPAPRSVSAIVVGRSMPGDPPAHVTGPGVDCRCSEGALGSECAGSCEVDLPLCSMLSSPGTMPVRFDGACEGETSCVVDDSREPRILATFDAPRSGTTSLVLLGAQPYVGGLAGAGPNRRVITAGHNTSVTIGGLSADAPRGTFTHTLWMLDAALSGVYVRTLPEGGRTLSALSPDGVLTLAHGILLPFDPGDGLARTPESPFHPRLVVSELDPRGGLLFAASPEPVANEAVLPYGVVVSAAGERVVLVETIVSIEGDGDREARLELYRFGPDGSDRGRVLVARWPRPPSRVRAFALARDGAGLAIAGIDELGASVEGLVPERTGAGRFAWALRVGEDFALRDRTAIDVLAGSLPAIELAATLDGRAFVATSALDASNRFELVLHELAADGSASATRLSSPMPCARERTETARPAITTLADGSLIVAAPSCPVIETAERELLISRVLPGSSAPLWTERISPRDARGLDLRGLAQDGASLLVLEQTSALSLWLRELSID